MREEVDTFQFEGAEIILGNILSNLNLKLGKRSMCLIRSLLTVKQIIIVRVGSSMEIFLKNIIAIFTITIISTSPSGSWADDTYTVLVQEKYPPFNIENEHGGFSGIDVDIIKRAAEIADVKLSFKAYPWARGLYSAIEGQGDVILGCGKKPEREKVLYYPATPARYVEIGFFVNEHFQGEINDLAQLKGQAVGVVIDYFASKEMDDNKEIFKDYSTDTETLFKKLANNRFKVAIYAKMSGIYELRKLGYEKFRYFPYLKTKDYPSYFAFSKKSPNGKELFDKLSPILKEMRVTGEIDKIISRYE